MHNIDTLLPHLFYAINGWINKGNSIILCDTDKTTLTTLTTTITLAEFSDFSFISSSISFNKGPVKLFLYFADNELTTIHFWPSDASQHTIVLTDDKIYVNYWSNLQHCFTYQIHLDEIVNIIVNNCVCSYCKDNRQNDTKGNLIEWLSKFDIIRYIFDVPELRVSELDLSNIEIEI